ncbi:hypothetical protein NPIL_315931 [Nephila pilipes]|uniref:Uncharacterized protein n=1 Tax=Nephila pilipes TaxID=299642 RepID=A0A8X6NDL5_NEPPI|nr:hypothetical protein NPIL_315931 [Nephila pilipes]
MLYARACNNSSLGANKISWIENKLHSQVLHANRLFTDISVQKLSFFPTCCVQTFNIFVANRVAIIQDLSCDEQWSLVSSVDNPADLISRGVNPSKMLESHLWFVHNCKPGNEKRSGHLTGTEMDSAEKYW